MNGFLVILGFELGRPRLHWNTVFATP